MSNESKPAASLADDLIWGVAGERGIAAEINRSPAETYHLISTGVLDGAVKKLGHKTIIASRRKLKNLLIGSDF